MKITTLLLLAGFLQLSAAGFSQTVTLRADNTSLKDVLKMFRQQTGYEIVGNTGMFSGSRKLTIDLQNTPFRDALNIIFSGQPLGYDIDDKTIFLKRLNSRDGEGVPQGTLQDKRVRGRVVNEAGQPLAGVNVSLKIEKRRVQTGSNGNFLISYKNEQDSLLFTMIGYRAEGRPVSAGDLTVVLQESRDNLDEVVVVGYGTQKRENLTGAIAVVPGKAFEDRVATNMSQLLQGAVPNMSVTFASGRPGNAGRFNIRGVNSISSNASPLIMVDGVEGNIDRVNPDDVASVTVLKDASAAAVYGARASYGVILITTKKGDKNKKDQPTVRYSGQYAFGGPTVSTDYETRGYYSAAINDLFYKKYAGVGYTNYTDDDYYQLWIRRNDKTENPERPWVVTDNRDGRETYVYYANTDWYHYLYNDNRPTQNHSVSVSGSSNKITYLLSGNYFNQDGIFRMNTDNFTRYNMRSKMTLTVNDWLEISNNTGYFTSSYHYPGQSGVENSFGSTNLHALASFVPVNPDGSPVYLNSLSNTAGVMDGISAVLSNGGHRNRDKISEFSPTFEVVVKPAKHVDIRANYSFIHYNYQSMNRSVNVPYSKYPGEIEYLTTGRGLDVLSEAQDNQWYKAFNGYGTYENQYGGKHNVKFMAGYNYETRSLKDLTMSRQGLLSEQLDDFDLAKGDVMNIGGGQNEYALLGAFYRFNYDYKGRYLFEAAGRYDGSSRFRKEDRFGFFPSFSAGWRLDEESFFQPLKAVIDQFKIRASYGSLGNQQVGYYDYIQTINTGDQINYSFGDGVKAPVAKESAPNASDLTWEKVSTSNLGLDLGLLKNRLTVTADAYIRYTKDMLTPGKTLPAVYGAASPKQNSADLKTKGWELAVSWADDVELQSKPFHYNIGIGLADNTSEITRFDNPTKNLTDFYAGEKLGQIWGYHIDGYFKSDEEAANYPVDQTSVNAIENTSAEDRGLFAGDLKFVDLDGDNRISLGANTADKPGDRTVIGNSLPRYNFNGTLGASWSGIDFSLFFQGIGKQNWYPSPEAIGFWGPYARPYTTYIPTDFLSNVWSPENPDAYFPRPRGYIALSATNRSLGVINDKYLQDLAYLRVKNITVGYTLPKQWTSKVKLDRCRIYFSGENLFTLTKLKSDYIDPEQASASNTYSVSTSDVKTYPWGKTFSFGLDISL